MPAIRTLLIAMSPLFTDVVKQALARHASLEVVGELDTCDALVGQRQAITPELILLGLRIGEQEREIGPMLLNIYPKAKVIAFSTDRRHAFVYRMRPYRAALIDLSPEALIKAIDQ
jgi:DNA-binding NarL/FixJ family response regulator